MGNQQDLYTIFVAQGVKIAEQHIESVKQNPNVIPKVMVAIVNRVEQTAEKRGIKFDISIKFTGAQEILAFLIKEAGIEIDEQALTQMIKEMVGIYLKQAVASGKMTQEEVIQLGQQAQQQMGASNGK
jgi:hypothetical protein